MRLALWLLGLFGVAVVLALFASDNPSTVTIFWPPYRIDLSLNLVVLLLTLFFLLLHFAVRALQTLGSMPAQAKEWRLRHLERNLHQALVDALLHWTAGRFNRARKSAEALLARARALQADATDTLDLERICTLAHLQVAESAQALRDRDARQRHLELALRCAANTRAVGTREAVLLRAVSWSLEDRDPHAALQWMDQLPSGAARRTVTLRLRLKVARMSGNGMLALDTARLLIKHRAFSPDQANSLLRALVLELIGATHDSEQLLTTWSRLEPAERSMTDVACAAAGRLLRWNGPASMALEWLLPVWERWTSDPDDLDPEQEVVLLRRLECAFSRVGAQIDPSWMARIEQTQLRRPGDANLQYLSGMACMHLQLWGKAQQLIQMALPRLKDARLQSRAWQTLAELAQREGDTERALNAWRNAAQSLPLDPR
ncbi:MAG: heme biosynthesis protein HemY [Rhodoferax sp.]